MAFAEAISQYYGNFVRNGDPNGDGLMDWKPYDSTKRATYFLDLPENEAKDDYRGEHCLYWATLIDTICTSLPCKCDGGCVAG